MIRPFLIFAISATLTACGPIPTPDVARLSEPELERSTGVGPPDARPGACYGRDVTPAVIETVTEQIILQPAELTSQGSVSAPAIYREETRQEIVQERRELWFEIPCGLETDPPFIATLQRALAARALYSGPVNGLYDARTRAAVRRYQRAQGLDSGILSLAAARQLGLTIIPRNELGG